MFSWSLPQRRRATVLFVVAVILLLASTLSLYSLPPHTRIRDYFPKPQAPSTLDSTEQDDAYHQPQQGALGVPPEYNIESHETPYCAEHFSRKYLDSLRDSATGYCTPDSPSNLTCFHSQTSPDSKMMDSFCFGKSALFDPTDKKFSLGCQPRELTQNEISRNIPKLEGIRSYWYDTGPPVIFDKAVKMDSNVEATSSTTNFTILIQREGAFNIWHCLMEIWSLTMTLDVLRIAIEQDKNAPFLVPSDVENTQIMILDELDNGPYFDLWTLFATRPAIRMKDLSENTKFENIVVPLAGASNPLWQGDWDIHSCDRSELLRTFTHRVLDFYHVDAPPHSGDLVLTFIDRQGSRQLMHQDSYFEELKAKIPHLRIQTIDFAALSFPEQLRISRETDILVGVHGAGLTQGMFLREGSVMVEMLPESLNHKGFRNLAGVLGHTYLSAHATKPPETEPQTPTTAPPKTKRDAWHTEDIYLEKERFMELMEVAIKVLYNKGLRNYDVN